ncbi:hypothetical protein V8G54_006345 [Vigna mungo]|uniref:Uncharacterized protein n=1 Tax=Vigna mungo TaxID=3915 RepID=A0AAQ3S779_VIGMU
MAHPFTAKEIAALMKYAHFIVMTHPFEPKESAEVFLRALDLSPSNGLTDSGVQTNAWECFCAIHWDPSHADCAVPQELETDQVLKQLKYVEVRRQCNEPSELGCNFAHLRGSISE